MRKWERVELVVLRETKQMAVMGVMLVVNEEVGARSLGGFDLIGSKIRSVGGRTGTEGDGND